MQIANKNDIIQWLKGKNIIDSGGRLDFSDYSESLKIRIPSDSGRKVALSEIIASEFTNELESLLWINEFGIWPSCEDWNLFEGFRNSLGEKEALYDKPGHFFNNSDKKDIKSLLVIVLIFCWGAIIAPSNKESIIQISHDEYLYFYSNSKERVSLFKSKTDSLLKEKT